MTNDMSPADIRACTCNDGNGYNNGFGGDGWWAILFLFALWGGWGNGGFGFGGGNGFASGALTRADLCQDMNFNQLENGVRGIQQGICDSTFALNNSIMNGFHGVDNAICNLGYQTQQGFNSTNIALMQGQNALQAQIAQCCCDNRAGQADIKYQMATDTCAIQNTIQNTTRDVIDNNNANTRAVLDFLVQDKISNLQNENNALRLAASQDRQNALLTTAMSAQTAQIINTLNPTPVPSYVVPNPNCCYNAQVAFNNCGGCNNGCGC